MLRGALVHDGIDREYFVYLPDAHRAGELLPVVIALHGYGGTATGFAMETSRGFNQYAERKGFIAVYPQSTHFTMATESGEPQFVSSWNDLAGNRADGPLGPLCADDSVQYPCPPECDECGRCHWTSCHDDVGFIVRVLEDLIENFRLDSERIYLTGMSNGAMMAQRLACEMPERFAAVALVAGRLARGYNCAPDRSVPLLQLNGRQDATVPPDGTVSADGYYYSSVEDVAAAWAGAARCAHHPAPWPDRLADRNAAQCTRYSSCKDPDMEVVNCLWTGGGHVWPGEGTGGGWCVGPEQAETVSVYPACAEPPTNTEVWGTGLLWEFFLRH